MASIIQKLTGRFLSNFIFSYMLIWKSVHKRLVLNGRRYYYTFPWHSRKFLFLLQGIVPVRKLSQKLKHGISWIFVFTCTLTHVDVYHIWWKSGIGWLLFFETFWMLRSQHGTSTTRNYTKFYTWSTYYKK